MLRRTVLWALLGLLGLGALAAGSDIYAVVMLGGLAVLGWLGAGRRQGRPG